MTDAKASLLADIADSQLSHVSGIPWEKASLYAGIPFCPTRCAYCSFASNVAPAEEREKYISNLIKECVTREILGTLEEHMLEEVCESGLAFLLTCTADMECNGLSDDRITVILMKNNLETIVQGVLLIVNVHHFAFVLLA